MKLMEFQGKRLFAELGLPVPKGTLLSRGQDASCVNVPVVLKSQVMTGGRGKAGGIRVVKEKEKLNEQLNEIFELSIKGERAEYVLCEEGAEIKKEMYVSVTSGGSRGETVIIASGQGGVEIETIAKEDPDKIVMITLDPLVGVTSYHARYIAEKIGCEDFKELHKVIKALYDTYIKYDAQLVEINPLALTDKGLMALDSKVILDNNARFRHAELFSELEKQQGSAAELGREDTITFVGLEGNVALISDGAGTGMLSLDMVHEKGGVLSSFCELGGVTNADVMYTAMKESLDWQGGAKCLLVVLIGGFNRMDHMAEGILRYKQENSMDIPIIVRMCGTMEQEGKKMLNEAGLVTEDDLEKAVEQAVALAKEA